jgi:adenosylhomocysteine nucleosidase
MRLAVIVAANAEWDAVKPMFAGAFLEHSPCGEYFFAETAGHRIVFFHGGWGKVAAAASTQYIIDRFKPEYLMNLGTCGGINGRVQRFDLVAAERTVIYDIYEAMEDSSLGLAHYTTEMEVPAGLPSAILRTTIYSADRDLTPRHLLEMEARHHPAVVDWESGAIAWVARRNQTRVLILRGVTDLVDLDLETAEAEGNLQLYRENARRVMADLIGSLAVYVDAFLAA